jgi:thiosulfate/3-mercaptopyruvate sulfurtransferase
MTDTGLTDPFVTTQWLHDHLEMPDLVIIDCSWYLPAMGRDGRAEYERQHIPKAVFFDIDAISDQTDPLPHMLPDPLFFASAVGKLGIGDGMKIIVYDGAGLFTAPRVWWTLRVFGARDVQILAGGLPKWLSEQRPVDEGLITPQPRSFTAKRDHSLIAGLEDVRIALRTQNVQVVDARPAPRFLGQVAEPRAGVRSGHMPGSLNLPFSDLIDNGQLRSPKELAAIFAKAGVDLKKPIITSCGSGVSAAILTLALSVLGAPEGQLYDGSWAQWGNSDDVEISIGLTN